MTSLRVLCLVTFIAASALLAAGVPRRRSADSQPAASEYADLQAAASGHHHGRVQIKVYRGPDEHHGHHEHFAPHGYWIKQPADDDHHH